MSRNLKCLPVILCLLALPLVGVHAAAEPARNVILMVADGAPYNTFNMASYFEYGALGNQVYDLFPAQYGATTYPLTTNGSPTGSTTPPTPYDPAKAWSTAADSTYGYAGYRYLRQNATDSGASATALSTGVKTYDGAINWANSPATTGAPLIGIAQIAKSLGLSVGVVTSVEWVHATPAALGGAHVIDRYDYASIGNQILSSNTVDVLMGAGNPYFDMYGAPQSPDYKYAGGEANWTAIANGTHPGGWTLVQTPQQFEALMTGPAPDRVYGSAQVRHTLQQERPASQDWNGDGTINDADAVVAPAFGDPFVDTVPTLETMTRGALNVLGQKDTGFFLAIEGGAVDWAAGVKQTGRAIEDMIDFNHSVQAVVDWVEAYSNWNETLLIVTSDHGIGQPMGPQSQLLPPDPNALPFAPIVNNGAGNMPGVYWESGSHSSDLVPVYAKGLGADIFMGLVDGVDPVRGSYIDNTDIFQVMYQVLPTPTLSYTGAANNRWEISQTGNWTTGNGPLGFRDGDHVAFNDIGPNTISVDITTTVHPASVTVNNDVAEVIFSGAGSIAGVGGLTKNGAGTLTVATTNSYTGDTRINAGTLIVAAGGALGGSAVTLGDTAGSADVALLVAGAITLDRPITVQDDGSGTSTRTLGGTNTSGTAVFGGGITLDHDVAMTAAAGGTVLLTGLLDNADGHTITMVGDGTLLVDGPQSHGPGSLLDVDAGTVRLNTDAGTAAAAYLSIDVTDALVIFGASQHLDTLSIGDGGRVVLNGAQMLSVKHLVISGLDFGPTVVTPEPATLALLTLGGLGMLLRRRRN